MSSRGCWGVRVVGIVAGLGAVVHATEVRAAVGAFTLTSPANGAFVATMPTLTWGGSSGATSYTLTVTPASGAALVKAGLTATSYAVAAGEALTEAGSPYTWHVTARDDGGTTRDSSTSSFFVDATPPTDFGLIAPAAGVFSRAIDARFTWEVPTDAGSGIAKYHFYVDGALCGDATTAGFAFLPSTCNPPDGAHTWAASAEDVAGNIKWCKEAPGGVGGRLINIDNTGPSAGNGGVFQLASANTPEQVTRTTDHMVNTGINVVPGDAITVTSTGSWCSLSCTSGCYDTAGYSDPVNTPTQSCNNMSLIARVGIGGTQFKCAGTSVAFTAGINDTGILELGSNSELAGCADRTVTATVTGGRTFTLTSPAADAVLNQQFPTFSWQAATDQGSGGVTYLLAIDGVDTGSSNTNPVGTIISDTTYTIPDRLGDGVHTWKVRARDAAGNVTDSTTRSFTVDTTRPDSFRLRMPGAGTCAMTPTPSLCWNNATDADQIANYQLWIDGVLAFTTTDNFTTCGTPSAALAQGTHTWNVVATDRAGNTRQSLETFSLLIDYTPPGAPALIAPADGVSSADPPLYTWAAATDAGGIGHYGVYLDDVLAATVSGTTLSWLSLTDPAPGGHTWYVRAIDACNQATSSVRRSFTTVACTPDAAAHPCPGYNRGSCVAGTRVCASAGTWGACTGVQGPTTEICNGADDDCDGVADNGSNGCGGVCTLPVFVYTPCDGPDADQCQDGVYMCDGLNSLSCVETTPVDVEVCNGRDDDCNGMVDDGITCTGQPAPDGGAPPDGAPPADGGVGGATAGTGGAIGTGGAGGRAAGDAGAEMDAAVVGTGGVAGTVGGAAGALATGTGGQGAANGPGGQPGLTDGGVGGGGVDAGAAIDAAARDAAATGGGGAGGSAAGARSNGGNSGCACATGSGAGASGTGWGGIALLVLALVRGRRRDGRPAGRGPGQSVSG